MVINLSNVRFEVQGLSVETDNFVISPFDIFTYDDYVQIRPLIVMANEGVDLINESDVPIIRISNIYHHISEIPRELDHNIISSIKSIVEKNMLVPKGYEVEDMFDYIKNLTKYIEVNMKGYNEIYKILEEIGD